MDAGIQSVGKITAIPPTVIACDKREAFAQGSPCDEAIHLSCCLTKAGLLRGACHRAARSLSSGAHSRDPLAPTRWLAMTADYAFGTKACTHKLRLFGNRWLMSALPPKATK
jgi:hypothetical protein